MYEVGVFFAYMRVCVVQDRQREKQRVYISIFKILSILLIELISQYTNRVNLLNNGSLS